MPHQQLFLIYTDYCCSSSNHRLLLSNRLFPQCATGDTGKGSQLCSIAIGGIPTDHKMIHSLSLPTVTYICMGELQHFHHSPTTSFLHFQPIQAPPSGSGLVCAAWPNVHLGVSLCHATQLIVHQGRSTPLPTMWYEHLVLRR